MADGYSVLAPVYDRLNDTVDYAAWADFLEACIERFGSGTSGTPKDGASILDLGCGTGSMTIELAKRGYDMTALDLSEDMLAEADVRAREAGLDNILFLMGGKKEWQGSRHEIMKSDNEALNDFVFASELFKKVRTAAQKEEK